MPIMVGTFHGERMMTLTAQHADHWNIWAAVSGNRAETTKPLMEKWMRSANPSGEIRKRWSEARQSWSISTAPTDVLVRTFPHSPAHRRDRRRAHALCGNRREPCAVLSRPMHGRGNRKARSGAGYPGSGIAPPTKEILRFAQNDNALARATRRLVMKRDGYRCTICGATEHLQVHHIVPRVLDGSNDPANLTTLCGSCHELLHRAEQSLEPERLDEYPAKNEARGSADE